MEYKNHPVPEASVQVKASCGGYAVGVRNMVLAALTEASKTDFKNSGDRQNFGAEEKRMWGLRDWKETREDLLAEVVGAVWNAMWGHYGASASPPRTMPQPKLRFNEPEPGLSLAQQERMRRAVNVLIDELWGEEEER